MIRKTLQQKIGQAMKAHDAIRLSTLRMLLSALNYEFIAKQHELTDEEELIVVRREAKKRKEAIEAYEKAGAGARAESEKAELAILADYLPAELSENEVEKLIVDSIFETGAVSVSDMGKVISLVKEKSKGAVDGATVAQMVRSKLI